MRKTLYPNHPHTNAAICTPAGSKGRLKQSQSGMTLVEVLVAMFVLAVGVLALLATQLRTVSSVREAESQTVVAQAVQNLMEGMQINPTLSVEVGVNGEETGWVRKRYDAIITGARALSYRNSRINNKTVRKCVTSGWCQQDTATNMDKRDLLLDQLGRFEDALARALPNADIKYTICNDTTGRAMAIAANGSTQTNCTGGDGDPLFIKVLWQVDTEKANENTLNSNASNNNKLVYTYEARMPD
ncbi:type IV pilus modification protein PilV [Neisseria dentiae]|uniref:type IV pilus modification protein PilV n=1 Tax=Neisseria dentiae TaxID=194197 RepID=UPI00211BC037|nr:type IV pilus modification protein PilV [Neisseria dentiae]MCQ9325416.1 type IV pilus modification protein PilV [Neisseria dentiae]